MDKTIGSASWRDRIDVFAAILGALLGIVISFLNLIYSNQYMITLGPMLIIVCLVYLAVRRKLLAPTTDPQASHSLVLIINIVFWLSLAASTYSLSTETLHRPVIYFILISIAASMIALQILYCRQKSTTYLILFEILLVSLSVRASAFWVFPTLLGSDPWGHLNYIQDFVDLGKIDSTHGDIYYLSYPIMHLNAASAKLITAVDYKAAMFLGAGLPLMLSTIFVFLLGRSLVNTRVGLLAALLISLADYHINYSTSITAMTFGIALFTMIIYLLIRDKANIGLATTVLGILLMFELIITHTVSAFIMFCFILFFLIGMYAYRPLYALRGTSQRSLVTPVLVVMFGTAMLAYWIFAGYIEGVSFFASVIDSLYEALATKAGFLERAPEAGGANPILNIMGLLILVIFAVVGCLLWLSRAHQSKAKVGLVAAIIMLFAVTLSFPTLGIRNIMPYRWFAFIYAGLGIVAAVAMLTIMSRIGYHKLGGIILICVVFVTSFFMITNNHSNMDSPVYAHELNQRLVFTNSEMAVAEKVVEVYDGRITTDLQYGGRVLETHMGRDKVSDDMLNEKTAGRSLVIWRDVMAERPIQIPGATLVLGQSYQQTMENSHHLIYRNNTSKAFLGRGL